MTCWINTITKYINRLVTWGWTKNISQKWKSWKDEFLNKKKQSRRVHMVRFFFIWSLWKWEVLRRKKFWVRPGRSLIWGMETYPQNLSLDSAKITFLDILLFETMHFSSLPRTARDEPAQQGCSKGGCSKSASNRNDSVSETWVGAWLLECGLKWETEPHQ